MDKPFKSTAIFFLFLFIFIPVNSEAFFLMTSTILLLQPIIGTADLNGIM